MKISIIGGAGTLGATTAFTIAQKNLVEEICLIDIKENIAKSHKMDMEQAIVSFSQTKIVTGTFKDLTGSDIVINTIGIPETKVSSRTEYLEGNLKITKQISEYLKQFSPDAIILTATNPVDVINSLLYHFTSFDKNRVIGFSLNDTYRFRWAISKVLDVDINAVQGFVLGEHGEHQCPLFSSVLVEDEKMFLSSEQQEEVLDIISNWFKEYQSLNSGRTSGWLSSVNLAYIVETIVRESNEIIPCSIVDKDGISIGHAVKLGKEGVRSIENLSITDEENKKWLTAKEKVSELVSSVLHR